MGCTVSIPRSHKGCIAIAFFMFARYHLTLVVSFTKKRDSSRLSRVYVHDPLLPCPEDSFQLRSLWRARRAHLRDPKRATIDLFFRQLEFLLHDGRWG